MPTIDPRTPVLVGSGQLTHTERTGSATPLGLAAGAAATALRETGGRLRERVDTVGFVNSISLPVADPAALLAAELSLTPRHTVATTISGTSPIELLSHGCAAIRDGSSEAMLIAGAEALKSFREGRYDTGSVPETSPPNRLLGSERSGIDDAAQAAGILQPVQFYPQFENALRAGSGLEPAAHEREIAELWQRFATVAKTNPDAWVTSGATAESLLDPSPGNRMIAHPYRKLLTANIFVDQGAALVLCSAETATVAGIPRENWVFVHDSAAAHDHWHVTERLHLDRSPAVAAIADHLLGTPSSGRPGIDDIAHVDLYSCFPSAVQVAAREYGIDLADGTRPPTVTGGLTFAGGPGNNYVTHSLAAMAGRLRESCHGYGLVTAVGWFLTKHAAVLLSPEPPGRPYRHHDPQSDVDMQPRRHAAPGYTGTATVETYTVLYDRDGTPEKAHVCCLTGDGARVLATNEDPGVAADLAGTDPIGSTVTLDGPRLSP